MTTTLPYVDELKAQAKRLRAQMAALGTPLSHSGALEMLAQQYGLHDWNTLHAKAATGANHRAPVAVGDFVRGRYMGQPCAGRVLSLSKLSQGRYRVTLQLDAPVDVVEFEGLSNWRSRITATLGADGRSAAQRSDGTPHLALEP